MFCMKCKNEIVDCTCKDIKERLESLKNSPYVGIAIRGEMEKRDAKNIPDGTAIFSEDGSKILVKILEDNSNEEQLAYTLETLEVIESHPIGKDPKVGEVFSVFHNKEYPQYLSWTLTKKDNS